MTTKTSDPVLSLSDIELETLQRAAKRKNLSIEENRRDYTEKELYALGIMRESYTMDEMRARGFDGKTAITSFDNLAKSASELLALTAPFGSGIKKWQLPVAVPGVRVLNAVFPPNTVVRGHIHAIPVSGEPGGGIRQVIKGSITYRDRKYGPGEWFYVPNGESYAFTTDPNEETLEVYDYGYTGHLENRFAPIPEEAD